MTDPAMAINTQLYITLPSSAPSTPPKQLRGFDKVFLEAGVSSVVEFLLMRRDLSYWDVAAQDWVIPAREIGLSVGLSNLTSGITVV